MSSARITVRAFLFGTVLSIVFAIISVLAERHWKFYSDTQAPILPYVFLLLGVAAINPILKLIRVVRTFSPAELLLMFAMGAVSAGVPSLGVASHLVPTVSGLFSGHWNAEQSRWDVYVEPYLNEDYFIAEPGTREAAVKVRDAQMELDRLQRVHRAARNLGLAHKWHAEAEVAMVEARKLPPEQWGEAGRGAVRQLAAAVRTLNSAKEWWQEHGEEHDTAEVLAAYPALIEKSKAETGVLKRALHKIEAKARADMEVFRGGLPDDMRAVPGFIYVSGEGFTAYVQRVRRFFHGTAALRQLQEAEALLQDTDAAAADARAGVLGRVDAALAKLEMLSDATALTETKKSLDREINRCGERLGDEQEALRGLHERRRGALAALAEILGEEISRRRATIRELESEREQLTHERDERVVPALAILADITDATTPIKELRAEIEAAGPEQYAAVAAKLRTHMEAFRKFDASLRRFLIGDIEWELWVRPILNWAALIFLIYMILMTFNILIFRQWSQAEKITYPLAELPAIIAGVDAGGSGKSVPILRSGLFWAGFAISFGVLGWNIFVCDFVPGLSSIKLQVQWDDYIRGSFLEGIIPHGRFDIFFALIGLTFLIPARVSFSLWSFQLVYFALLIALVGLGHGVNAKSFQSGWFMEVTFRTGIGGGALIVFAAIMLWRCRRYLFCCLAPKGLEKLETDEKTELRRASFLFLLGSVVFIAVMTFRLGSSVFWSTAFYLAILVVTVGMIRAVAEGGLLTFQTWFGPFHILRSLFGSKLTWAPGLLAPLVVLNTMLFMELKACIAPAMANALKIREKIGGRMRGFHLALGTAVVCSFFVGVIVHIICAYSRGANAMNTWYYKGLPKQIVFPSVKHVATSLPLTSFTGTWWVIAGAIVMAALLYSRRRVFWLPHPIGLIMWTSPVMHALWFSILLGWGCKSLVSRYGGKDSYVKLRYLFIGLIVGEMVIFILAPQYSLSRKGHQY